jgi:hypothetical protein
MPAFLEKELKKEYPNNSHAVFGTMNKIGAMKGNKETAKGKAMQAKHERHESPHQETAEEKRLKNEATHAEAKRVMAKK